MEKNPRFFYVDDDGAHSTPAAGPLEHLKCPICLEYITKIAEMPCTHMACWSCLDAAAKKSGSTSCPSCRSPYTVAQLTSSGGVQRILDSIPVFCAFKPAGCTWTGARGDVSAHQTGCIFRDPEVSLVMKIRITAGDDTFYLPFEQAQVVSICIDWGDGRRDIVTKKSPGYAYHNYSKPGLYTVSVLPHGPAQNGCWLSRLGRNLPVLQERYTFSEARTAGWANRIQTFVQLGRLGIVSLSCLFAECDTFNVAVNHLNMSHILDTSFMFWEASKFNQPLDSWDVSNVANMYVRKCIIVQPAAELVEYV
jgi:surface protein